MKPARLLAVLLPILLLVPTTAMPQVAVACSCVPQTVADIAKDALVVRVGRRAA